jgi:hypothetical protein
VNRCHLSLENPKLIVAASSLLRCRAEGRDSDSSFMTGFVLGGVVFGMLGFLFAPQVRM